MSDDERIDEEDASSKAASAAPAETATDDAKNAEASSSKEASSEEASPPAEDTGSTDGSDAPGSATAEADAADDSKPAGKSAQKAREGFISRHFFSLLAVVLLVEVIVYGRRGQIDVCVAKDKVHDFALLGQERTEVNRWRFPQCESRTNLSMVSHYDELVAHAKQSACRRATQLRQRGEAPLCIKSADGWQFRVDTRQVWPWEKPFYRTMFHLD